MKFSISRLNTDKGIFRLSGEYQLDEHSARVECSKAEFMGSDGWCELDLDSLAGLTILTAIEPEIVKHLNRD